MQEVLRDSRKSYERNLMSRANNKTTQTDNNVDAFLDNVTDQQRREDAKKINELLKKVTKEPPKMWGPSIVGFGKYHYKYDSGREGDFLKIGFSPRKASLSIYLMDGFDKYQDELKQLGKHKTSVSCLYLKKLTDIDLKILEAMLKKSYNSPAMGES